jgi:hypothetical protein
VTGDSGATGSAASRGGAFSVANSGARGNGTALSGTTGDASNITSIATTGGAGAAGGSASAAPGQAGAASNTTASPGAVGITSADATPVADFGGGAGGDARTEVAGVARSGDSGLSAGRSSADNSGTTGSARSTARFDPNARSGDSGATGSTGGQGAALPGAPAHRTAVPARPGGPPVAPVLGPLTSGHPHGVRPALAGTPGSERSAGDDQALRRLALTGLPLGRLAGDGVLALVLGCLLLGIARRRSTSNAPTRTSGISQHDSNTDPVSITGRVGRPRRPQTLDQRSRASA